MHLYIAPASRESIFVSQPHATKILLSLPPDSQRLHDYTSICCPLSFSRPNHHSPTLPPPPPGDEDRIAHCGDENSDGPAPPNRRRRTPPDDEDGRRNGGWDARLLWMLRQSLSGTATVAPPVVVTRRAVGVRAAADKGEAGRGGASGTAGVERGLLPVCVAACVACRCCGGCCSCEEEEEGCGAPGRRRGGREEACVCCR